MRKRLLLTGMIIIFSLTLFGCSAANKENKANVTPQAITSGTPAVSTQVSLPGQTATAAPEFTGKAFSDDGISMVVPDCLPVEPVIVWDSSDVHGDKTCKAEKCYSHRKVVFENYPLTGTNWPAQIDVFRIAGYAGNYYEDTDAAQLGDQVIMLQYLLLNQKLPVGAHYPFVPITGQIELTGARGNILDFENGKGIFYLAQFGEEYVSINNSDLIYTYQGLTDDGLYWVTAIFPINYPNFPVSAIDPTVLHPDENLPHFSFSGREEDWWPYIFKVNEELNSAPDEVFTPSLHCLETMVRSLKVGLILID